MTRNVFLKIISSDKKDIIEWTQIENEEYSEFLLHGVTGSRENRGLFTTN